MTTPSNDHVRIFDTTLRDGEQSPGATLTSVEKLELSNNARLSSVDLGALDRAEALAVVNNPQLDPSTLAALRTFEANITGNAQPPAAP